MRFFMIISLAALSFATASQADGHMGDLQMQPLLRSSFFQDENFIIFVKTLYNLSNYIF